MTLSQLLVGSPLKTLAYEYEEQVWVEQGRLLVLSSGLQMTQVPFPALMLGGLQWPVIPVPGTQHTLWASKNTMCTNP